MTLDSLLLIGGDGLLNRDAYSPRSPRFHDLRHTFATRMVQAGVDHLYKVQRLPGHKSPVMTQRYTRHYPESLRDGVEVLDVRRPISTN